MAFGQQSGPPASHTQVRQLTELVTAAGHSDFRDARGPLGLTQRQAGGKFTRDEADDLIVRLEAEADVEAEAGQELPTSTTEPTVDPRDAQRAAALQKLPAHLLAAELQRRGWAVMEP